MKKKSLAVLMIFIMVMTMMPATAFAAISTVDAPREFSQLISSEGLEHNFVKVTTSGSSLYFEV
ncbi:MAG: hypothetical protein IKT62_04340, partial [Firmicutes bacterium]|nr:hypothetical protein [Bacillota bacterium]